MVNNAFSKFLEQAKRKAMSQEATITIHKEANSIEFKIDITSCDVNLLVAYDNFTTSLIRRLVSSGLGETEAKELVASISNQAVNEYTKQKAGRDKSWKS